MYDIHNRNSYIFNCVDLAKGISKHIKYTEQDQDKDKHYNKDG